MVQDNYDLAIADTTQIIKLKPDYALAYFTRGFAYKAKKDQLNAVTDFKKCLELNIDPALREIITEQLKELETKK